MALLVLARLFSIPVVLLLWAGSLLVGVTGTAAQVAWLVLLALACIDHIAAGAWRRRESRRT